MFTSTSLPGLNERKKFVRIDNGLNSPYFPEIWTKVAVLLSRNNGNFRN